MQRIVVQFAGTAEQIVEQRFLAFEIPFEQRLGQGTLVAKVMEEAAFGDPNLGDQLLDGRGGETLVQNRSFRRIQQTFAGVCPALAFRSSDGSSFCPQTLLHRRYS